MSEYKTQNARYANGTSAATTTLTALYSGNQSSNIPIGGMSQAVVACYYTPKSGQSNRTMYVKAEFSYDGGTTWVPLSKGSDAAVASNIIITTVYDWEFAMAGATGGTTYYQRIPINIGEYGIGTSPVMRISIKEDGSADFGAAKTIVSLSG